MMRIYMGRRFSSAQFAMASVLRRFMGAKHGMTRLSRGPASLRPRWWRRGAAVRMRTIASVWDG